MDPNAKEFLVDLSTFAVEYTKAQEGSIDQSNLQDLVLYYYHKSLQDYLIDREIEKAEKVKKEISEALSTYFDSVYSKSFAKDALIATAHPVGAAVIGAGHMKKNVIEPVVAGVKAGVKAGAKEAKKVYNTNVKQSVTKADLDDLAMTMHPLHLYAHYLDDNGGFDWSKCDTEVFNVDEVPREVINEINSRHGQNYFPHIHCSKEDLNPMGYTKSATNLLETEMSEMHEVLHRADYNNFSKGIYAGEHPLYSMLASGASMTSAGNEIPNDLKQHVRKSHGGNWDNHPLEVRLVKAYNTTSEDQFAGVDKVAYEKNLGVILPIAAAAAGVAVDAAVKSHDAKLRRDADGTTAKLKQPKHEISHKSAEVNVEKASFAPHKPDPLTREETQNMIDRRIANKQAEMEYNEALKAHKENPTPETKSALNKARLKHIGGMVGSTINDVMRNPPVMYARGEDMRTPEQKSDTKKIIEIAERGKVAKNINNPEGEEAAKKDLKHLVNKSDDYQSVRAVWNINSFEDVFGK